MNGPDLKSERRKLALGFLIGGAMFAVGWILEHTCAGGVPC